MNRKGNFLLVSCMSVALTAGFTVGADKKVENPNTGENAKAGQTDAKGAKKQATVRIMGAGDMKGKIKGNLNLTEAKDGVKVKGKITGLTPGKHGFHVHEKGDLSDPKLTCAGSHFNPGGVKHGGPESHEKHAGDWANIEADAEGTAMVDATFVGVSIDGEKNGIMGRSVIIHAGPDDLKSDPSGNSGDRIAGGVIEKKEAKEASEGAEKGDKKEKKGKKEKSE